MNLAYVRAPLLCAALILYVAWAANVLHGALLAAVAMMVAPPPSYVAQRTGRLWAVGGALFALQIALYAPAMYPWPHRALEAREVFEVCIAGPAVETALLVWVPYVLASTVGGYWFTLLVVAAVFAGSHYDGSLVGLEQMVVGGVLYGTIVVETKGTPVALAVHVVWNVAALALVARL